MVEWLHGLMVGEVSIYVMNMLGQKVFSFEESRSIGTSTSFSAGEHSDKKEIDLTHFPDGVYFITLLHMSPSGQSENFSFKKKIIIAH